MPVGNDVVIVAVTTSPLWLRETAPRLIGEPPLAVSLTAWPGSVTGSSKVNVSVRGGEARLLPAAGVLNSSVACADAAGAPTRATRITASAVAAMMAGRRQLLRINPQPRPARGSGSQSSPDAGGGSDGGAELVHPVVPGACGQQDAH